MDNKLDILRKAIIKLHEIVDGLNNKLPRINGKPRFTLDGRLIGDIGEEIASVVYQIVLYEKQVPEHDGETRDGKRIQIKCTFKNHLTFKHTSDYYIGLKLYPNGDFKEVYNGPGIYIYNNYKDRRSNLGEVLLSFKIDELAELSRKIPKLEKIESFVVIDKY